MAENSSSKVDLQQLVEAFGQSSSDFGKAAQWYGMSVGHDINAGLLELDAEWVLIDAEYQAKRLSEKGDKVVGSQVAKYAKAGVTFEGSPMKVRLETEKNIRMDIMTTRYNAVRKATAIGWQAVNEKMAAGRARTRMVQSIGTGILNMPGSYAKMSGGE